MNTPCFVLAGGQSKRFGQDKSLYLYQGKAFILHIIDQLKSHFPAVMVLCNQPDKFKDLQLTAFQDLVPHSGPMMGVITGLTIAVSQGYSGYVFFASCDVLDFDFNQLKKFQPHFETSHSALVFTNPEGFYEPLWGFYHTQLLPPLQEQFDSGEHALQAFLKTQNFPTLIGNTGTNHNTPEQLR